MQCAIFFWFHVVWRVEADDVARASRAMMAERGRAEGIAFNTGGNVSQTTDSHRLITKAKELKGEEGQIKLVERCVAGATLDLSFL